MELIPSDIFQAYGISTEAEISQLGSGLINRTFLVFDALKNDKYVLQEINTQVFTRPEIIANNVEKVRAYLAENHPSYLFPAPIKTKEGDLMLFTEDGAWRLQPYIENSTALETVPDPKIAFEAAAQFGKLSRLLKNFPIQQLAYPIEQFHDLKLRILQYKLALENAGAERKIDAGEQIRLADYYQSLSAFYESYKKRNDFPDRVIHHDTKISNVLLDRDDYRGICVIDLDTLMPGKYISDLGDMMRTYLSPFSENETDLTKINVRPEYFEAIIKGYLSEMQEAMTDTEKELLLFSGKYIIYMQALRFLTDYLNGDKYYKTAYPQHNLDRAKNQFALLKDLYKKEPLLQSIINKALK